MIAQKASPLPKSLLKLLMVTPVPSAILRTHASAAVFLLTLPAAAGVLLSVRHRQTSVGVSQALFTVLCFECLKYSQALCTCAALLIIRQRMHHSCIASCRGHATLTFTRATTPYGAHMPNTTASHAIFLRMDLRVSHKTNRIAWTRKGDRARERGSENERA